jgi:hypothetical protein
MRAEQKTGVCPNDRASSIRPEIVPALRALPHDSKWTPKREGLETMPPSGPGFKRTMVAWPAGCRPSDKG